MRIETPSESGLPVGAVLPFAGDSIPNGFLNCNGQAVSRATYAKLFSALGVSHGEGDGSTTFNVPDYRGRFLRGIDGLAGRDADVATRTAMNTGGATGNNVGSVQDDQYKSHNHVIPYLKNYNNAGSGLNAGASSAGYSASISTNSAGGSETRPKNAYVNYIIKT